MTKEQKREYQREYQRLYNRCSDRKAKHSVRVADNNHTAACDRVGACALCGDLHTRLERHHTAYSGSQPQSLMLCHACHNKQHLGQPYKHRGLGRGSKHQVTVNGERVSLAKACKMMGKAYSTVYTRIFKQGLDPMEALMKGAQ